MRLKNRSRVEIIYDIVSAANPSGKKTHLMYKGNLSYGQLEAYLSFILESGLLEETRIDDSRVYVITKKGSDFLKLYESMDILLHQEKPVEEEQIARAEI